MGYYFSKFSGGELGVSDTGLLIINALLVVFLLTCAYTDGTVGKIYNKFTFPTMLLGLILNGVFAGGQGLTWSLIGLAVGMGIQWIPFMVGAARAGDVKLLMAVGALKGWAFCVFGFVYGAAAFAFLILPWLAKRGELGQVRQNLTGYFQMAALTQSAPDAPAPTVTKRFVPWGVALALGFLIALVLELRFGRPLWFA